MYNFDFSTLDGYIFYGDNLPVLQSIPSDFIDLVYIDPPFNTNKVQSRTVLEKNQVLSEMFYIDKFDDYYSFLYERLKEIHRVLSHRGTLYFHIDYREVHYCKLLLDMVFGRENFLNEIIWAYDFGGRPRNKWPCKHDNILVYTKSQDYIFNADKIDRIPYMAPGLQKDKERVKKGKLPTDVWWHTIVHTNGKEKTGYPTQKPINILKRIIQASSFSDSIVLDCFAGSGTTGAACLELGRKFILVDNNKQALDVMQMRFKNCNIQYEHTKA